jgi:hypothetical protein
MKTDKNHKSYVQHTLIGTAIFSIIILHFVWQFAFFQNAELRSEKITPPNLANKTNVAAEINAVEVKTNAEVKAVEGKTEQAAKKPERVKAAAAVPVAPVIRAEPKIAPAKMIIKKKEFRESTAERLRRAEKLLTGV